MSRNRRIALIVLSLGVVWVIWTMATILKALVEAFLPS